MILGSAELYKFVVEPGMKFEPFDPKQVKELELDHPYKYILWVLYKYNPSYSSGKGNDANPDRDGYDDDVVDYYFSLLDDFSRYGIVFSRKFNLYPDNKLFAHENEDHSYTILNNYLFNKKNSSI